MTWLFFTPPALGLMTFGALRLARERRRRLERAGDRNPGPEGSAAMIGWSLQNMPGWFNRAALRVSAFIAQWTLHRQRACSREYLRLILGREPSQREVWTHFFAFGTYLILRVQVCHGRTEPRLRFAESDGDDLRARIHSGGATLYGTMHLGHSDLVGFFLGQLGERVYIVRKQVGNSEDTERLARLYAQHVSFIWINDWSRLVLAMNDALREGRSIGLQCDRLEYSSKRESFQFLGERRLMPFTIYHLAIMHGFPVSMSFAVPDEEDPQTTVVHMQPLFHPRADLGRQENFEAARVHFQQYLDRVEAQLRRTPYLWFNFTPINPPASAVRPARARRLEGGRSEAVASSDAHPAV
jgi:predicted LPLAT superfamily acyltransferase